MNTVACVVWRTQLHTPRFRLQIDTIFDKAVHGDDSDKTMLASP